MGGQRWCSSCAAEVQRWQRLLQMGRLAMLVFGCQRWLLCHRCGTFGCRWSPLSKAGEGRHYGIIECLVEHGADPHEKDEEGYTSGPHLVLCCLNVQAQGDEAAYVQAHCTLACASELHIGDQVGNRGELLCSEHFRGVVNDVV
jgi:hypothetical protein